MRNTICAELRNVSYTPEQSPYWHMNEFNIFILSNICNEYFNAKKKKNLMFPQIRLAQQFLQHRMNGKITLGMQGEMLTHGKTSSDCWLHCGQEACNRGSIERISLEHWEVPSEWSVEVMKAASRTMPVSNSLGQHPCVYNIYGFAQCSMRHGAVWTLWQLLPKCAALGLHMQTHREDSWESFLFSSRWRNQ